MAQQPVYHRAVVLFTARNREFTREQFGELLRVWNVRNPGDEIMYIDVEEMDEPEWGDPGDL